ncbi:MAG: hypothetical protein CMP08_07685 [Xanthomonadales bacterium]|nr:hypothetical protein [Xanthomonadales bacterium]|tara:strand:+ start:139 stop:477 length:339 start_codon:yes stop_codon:yes gene_type:complete
MTEDLIISVLTILGGIAALQGGTIWMVRIMIDRGQRQTQQALDKHLTDSREHDRAQDQRIEAVEQQISQLHRDLPETYMRRDDYVQSFSRIEQKIDAIWEYMRNHLMKPRGD